MDLTTEHTALVNPTREYIASISIVRHALYHFEVLTRPELEYFQNFKSSDRRSLDRYRFVIRGELEHLHDLTVKAKCGTSYCRPVTVPANAYQQLSEEYQVAIEALNDELRQFASRHKDTTFAGTIEWLKGYPESDVFVDDCCHLSERGNDIVAGHRINILTRK